MKIKKLLMHFMPILGTAILPISFATSCNDNKIGGLALGNGQITVSGRTFNTFCLSGNFNQGSSYDFVADLKIWDTPHQKPTETDFKTWDTVEFGIIKSNQSQFTLINTNQIKIICDNKELKQGTKAETQSGTADWYIEFDDEVKAYYFYIKQSGGSPVSYNSVVQLQNVQFSQNTENVCIEFGSIDF